MYDSSITSDAGEKWEKHLENLFTKQRIRDFQNNKMGKNFTGYLYIFNLSKHTQSVSFSECFEFPLPITILAMLHIRVSSVAGTSGSLQTAMCLQGAQARS
jgi:hypothetical protein